MKINCSIRSRDSFIFLDDEDIEEQAPTQTQQRYDEPIEYDSDDE